MLLPGASEPLVARIRAGDGRAILGLALVAFAVLARFTVLGEALLAFDVIRHYPPYGTRAAPEAKNLLDTDAVLAYPVLVLTSRDLHAGDGARRWVPETGTGKGSALLGVAVPDYLPWRLAHRLLSPWRAHGTVIFLHLALALAGGFFLARSRGASLEGGLVAALVLGLSGELSVWLEVDTWTIAIAWLPWTLAGIERGLRDPRWLGLSAFALGSTILGGHLQGAVLSCFLVPLYALFAVGGPIPRRALACLVTLVLGCGIGSARLVPALTEVREYGRDRIPFPEWFDETASLTPGRLVLGIAPELHGDPVSRVSWDGFRGPHEAYANPQELRFTPGVVGLALVVCALARRRNLGLGLLALLVLVLAMPTPLGWILWRFVPSFANSAPTRILFVLPVLLGLLAQAGFDEGVRERRTAVPMAALVAIILVLGVGVTTGLVPRAPAPKEAFDRALLKPLLLALAALTVVLMGLGEKSDRRTRRLARAALVALLAFDLAEALVRWNPTAPPGDVFSTAGKPLLERARDMAGHDRLLADEGLEPTLLVPLGVRGLGDYSSGIPARFSRLIAGVSPPLQDMAASAYFRGHYALARALPEPWRDSLSVRAVLLNTGYANPTVPDGLTFVGAGEVRLYENPTALPRARLVPASRVFVRGDEESALELAKSDRFDPRSMLVVERKGETRDPPGEVDSSARARVTLERDEPEVVQVRVTGAPAAGHLFLADAYASGWRAELDGAAADILPGNVAFRAVAVPAGDHTVTFLFTPPGWPWAIWASVASALLALGISALGGRFSG